MPKTDTKHYNIFRDTVIYRHRCTEAAIAGYFPAISRCEAGSRSDRHVGLGGDSRARQMCASVAMLDAFATYWENIIKSVKTATSSYKLIFFYA